MSKPGLIVMVRFQLKGLDEEEAVDFIDREMSFDSLSWENIVDFDVVDIKTLKQARHEKVIEKEEDQ